MSEHSSLRLAELIAAVALAADAGAALMPETSLRTCRLALALARACDLPEEAQRDVFYAALLRHVGCTASAHEETRLMGDEVELRQALGGVDMGRPAQVLPAIIKGFARGQGALRKAARVGSFLARGGRAAPLAFRGRCEVAVRFAVRLGLGARIEAALDHAYERWDGKGLPRGVRGESIERSARVIAVAELVSLFLPAGGLQVARELVAARSGGQLDPGVATAFLAHAGEIVATVQAPALWEHTLAAEPKPHALLGASRLGVVAELLADYADMKSPFTLGHSRAVAELSVAAAGALGVAAPELEALRLAALLHDVGRVSVSNAIWDKPAALDAGEREKVRAHSYETERLLARAGSLAPYSRLASLAHERLDASGYHRGLAGSALDTSARVLAAADVAQALTQPRAYRPALPLDELERALSALTQQGALCSRAVGAVLVACGARRARARAEFPRGLTEREVQVLRLVARGLTDKEIAVELSISHRTVHHHNQHAFTKLGVTTRAAAALFLIENDLLS